MNIRIKTLELVNFKGIRAFKINLNGGVTTIYGDNATGKSTLFDAFTWLLFGKDSHDRKEFEIKTLVGGVPIHNHEHSVYAIIDVDGKEITLKREFREKWQKRRGEEKKEFNGHETIFHFNEVPVSQKEYQQKVSGIVDEEIFKLLTNPFYFNSVIDWKKRRDILFTIGGTVTDEEIASTDKEFYNLVAMLENKSMEEYRRELVSKRNKMKEEISSIPARIDELRRSIPVIPEGIEKQLIHFKQVVSDYTGQIESEQKRLESKNKAEFERQEKVLELEQKLSNMHHQKLLEHQRIVNEHKNQIELQRDLLKAKRRFLENSQTKKEDNLLNISRYEAEAGKLREEWKKLNERTIEFNDNEFVCPTCNRPYPDDNVEEMKAEMEQSFNSNKQKKLAEIQTTGKRLVAEANKLKAESSGLDVEILKLENEILQIGVQLSKVDDPEQMPESKEEYALKQKIAALSTPIKVETSEIVPEIEKQRDAITIKIADINKQLGLKSQVEKINARIAELEEDEKRLAVKIAMLEREEFAIQRFLKAKIEAIEENINKMFSFVKFKMYEEQVNGGEKEICVALIEGVPFPDANHAAQINAGIDIINTLSNHYNTSAPIWIDNSEAVNKLLETTSQLIKLQVSHHEQLTIIEE